MYSLTYNGKPVSKPQKHREVCIVEALERGVIITGRFSHNVTYMLKDGWDIVEVSEPIMDESGFQIGEVNADN